jgi:hypothetical protein
MGRRYLRVVLQLFENSTKLNASREVEFLFERGTHNRARSIHLVVVEQFDNAIQTDGYNLRRLVASKATFALKTALKTRRFPATIILATMFS